jgi:hypothetical protein
MLSQKALLCKHFDVDWERPGTLSGGEGGIRTPDTVARMPHFECGAIDHSATSPAAALAGVFNAFPGKMHARTCIRDDPMGPGRSPAGPAPIAPGIKGKARLRPSR